MDKKIKFLISASSQILFFLYLFLFISIPYQTHAYDKGLIEHNYQIFKGHDTGPGGWFMNDNEWVRAYKGASIATRGKVYIKGDFLVGTVTVPQVYCTLNYTIVDSITSSFNAYFHGAALGSVGDIDDSESTDTSEEAESYNGDQSAYNANCWAGFTAAYLTTWQSRDPLDPADAFLNYNNKIQRTANNPPNDVGETRGTLSIADRYDEPNQANRIRMDRRRNFAIAQNNEGSRILLNMARLNFDNNLTGLTGYLAVSLGDVPRWLVNEEKKVAVGTPCDTGSQKLKINGDLNLSDRSSELENYIYLSSLVHGLAYTEAYEYGWGALTIFSNDYITLSRTSDSTKIVKFDVNGNTSVLIRGAMQFSDSSTWDSYMDNQARNFKSLHFLKPVSIGTYKYTGDPTPKARLYFNGLNITSEDDSIYMEKNTNGSESELRVSIAKTADSNAWWQIGTIDKSIAAGGTNEYGDYPVTGLPSVHFTAETQGKCKHVEIFEPRATHLHDDDHGDIDPLNFPSAMLEKQNNYVFSRAFSANGVSIKASDIRLKTHIEPITKVLEQILSFHGVSFSWKTAKELKKEKDFFYKTTKFLKKSFIKNSDQKDKNKNLGLIAQDVGLYFPELVYTNSEGYKQLNYEGLIPLLIEGVKEREDILNSIKLEIESLRNSLNKLETKK
jgi:hypothetical protein